MATLVPGAGRERSSVTWVQSREQAGLIGRLCRPHSRSPLESVPFHRQAPKLSGPKGMTGTLPLACLHPQVGRENLAGTTATLHTVTVAYILPYYRQEEPLSLVNWPEGSGCNPPRPFPFQVPSKQVRATSHLRCRVV